MLVPVLRKYKKLLKGAMDSAAVPVKSGILLSENSVNTDLRHYRTIVLLMIMIKYRGSNIGLAGCGMGLKIEAGCDIQRKLEAGCGMKSSSRDRDTQFFSVGMRDVLKSMAG